VAEPSERLLEAGDHALVVELRDLELRVAGGEVLLLAVVAEADLQSHDSLHLRGVKIGVLAA
jgi:hypothetical protein